MSVLHLPPHTHVRYPRYSFDLQTRDGPQDLTRTCIRQGHAPLGRALRLRAVPGKRTHAGASLALRLFLPFILPGHRTTDRHQRCCSQQPPRRNWQRADFVYCLLASGPKLRQSLSQRTLKLKKLTTRLRRWIGLLRFYQRCIVRIIWGRPQHRAVLRDILHTILSQVAQVSVCHPGLEYGAVS